jgi:hypothetical protein
MSKSFEKSWVDYETRVVHPGAGEIQRKETRQAFYAGAMALLTILFDLDGEEASYKEFDSVVQELKGFADEVICHE